MKSYLHKCGHCLSFLAMMMLLLHPTIVLSQQQKPESKSKNEASSETDVVRKIRRRTRMARMLMQEAIGDMNRQGFDPDAVIERIGSAPEAAFTWVQNRTRWVPYRGVLRGGKGVLMDRSGNSLDRSLLLASLLKRQGFDIRLAHGTVSPDTIRNLLKKQAEQPVPERFEPDDKNQTNKNNDSWSKVSRMLNVSDQKLKTQFRKIIQKSQRMQEDLHQRVRWQSQHLLNVVQSHLKQPDNGTNTERNRQVQAGTHHWWVQFKSKQEKEWRSLDPLPGTNPGKTLTQPEATMKPGKIPSKHYQRVTLKVIAEQTKEKSRSEKTVLSKTLTPSKVLGKNIQLIQAPRETSDKLTFKKNRLPDPKKVRSFLKKQKEWVPILIIDGEKTIQKGLTTSGNLNEKPAGSTAQAKKVKKATSALGALGGSGNSGNKKSDGQLTAEWIEYTLHIPGKKDQTIRRTVFDLIDPAKRSSGKVAKASDLNKDKRALRMPFKRNLLFQNCWLSPNYVQYLKWNNFVRNYHSIQQFIIGVRKDGLKNMDKRLKRISPFPASLYSLALARYQSAISDRLRLTRPNIVSNYKRFSTNENKKLTRISGFDYVTNEVSALVHDRASSPFKSRLKQGVLDTVSEAMILSDQTVPGSNASLQLKNSRLTDVSWTLLQKRDQMSRLNEQLPSRARAHLKSDLENGYFAYVIDPSKQQTNRYGPTWFRIDPTTGQVVGMAANGRGNVTTEQLIFYTELVGHFITGMSLGYGIAKCVDTKSPDKMPCCILQATAGTIVGSLAGSLLAGLSVVSLGLKAASKSAFEAGFGVGFGGGSFVSGLSLLPDLCP